MPLEPRSRNQPFLDRVSRSIAPPQERKHSENSKEHLRSIVFALHRDSSLWTDSLPFAVDRILESAMKALEVHVASVWQLGRFQDELICIAQHEADLGAVEPTLSLKQTTAQEYFQAVSSSRILAINDVKTEEVTRELREDYFTPHDVRALLVATFRRKGEFQGALYFENLGQPREWTIAEQEFSVAIAELLNQRLLFARLQDQNRLLSLLNGIAPEIGREQSSNQLVRLGMEKLSQIYPEVWASFYKVLEARQAAKMLVLVGEEIPEFIRVSLDELRLSDEYLAGVLADSSVHILEDCTAENAPDSPLLHISMAAGVKSLITIPLRDESHLLGFIQVWLKDRVAAPDANFEGFQAIARTFASAYANTLDVERLRHNVYRDATTGLFNREQFFLDRARMEDTDSLMLILIDICDFKMINDTLGRNKGDMLLHSFASRLELFTELKNEGRAYRFSGAEFCLLFSNHDGAEDLLVELRTYLSAPVVVQGIHIVLNSLLGAAEGPDAAFGKGLLKRADRALTWAAQREDKMALYHPEKDNLGPQNTELLADLVKAIDQDELSLYYQPTFDLANGDLVGCEALLRWTHPVHGDVLPERFVSVATSGDIMRKLTSWVLRQSVSQASIFQALDMAVPISVNVSAPDVLDSEFPIEVSQLLQEFDVDPGAITLEITEATIMSDPDRVFSMIRTLGNDGIRVDIDDFGSGFSSISQLGHLPIGLIKIDHRYISDIVTNPKHRIVVSSMIAMAHKLGRMVVAEGVETNEVAECLRGLGCDQAQGYYFGQPVPSADFIAAHQQP